VNYGSIGAPTCRWTTWRDGSNPIVSGWINYYGRFYRSALNPLLRRVNAYVRRWAGRKYTRLRTQKRYGRWLAGLLLRQPDLFAHWRLERSY
jgi:RNA-directed DNA polymerase